MDVTDRTKQTPSIVLSVVTVSTTYVCVGFCCLILSMSSSLKDWSRASILALCVQIVILSDLSISCRCVTLCESRSIFSSGVKSSNFVMPHLLPRMARPTVPPPLRCRCSLRHKQSRLLPVQAAPAVGKSAGKPFVATQAHGAGCPESSCRSCPLVLSG